MVKLINILLIPNTNNRNEQFLPIFEMIKTHIKYTEEESACVRTDISMNSSEYEGWNILQTVANSRGYSHCLYQLNKEK